MPDRSKNRSRSTPKTASPSPITPDDLLRLAVVADPRISPDSQQVVFVVKGASAKKKSEYETNLWLVDTAGGAPRQFTTGGKDGQPRWSPDGSRIAFVSGRVKHHPQVYTIAAQGGEAQPLTRFPEGSIGRILWSPDGTCLAVSFRPQNESFTEAAKKKREEIGASTPARVLDDWWYRLDGDGYFGAQRFCLYLVDAASGDHRLLYRRDTLGSFDFDFSPDGSELVVATNRDRLALVRPWKDELVRIDVKSGDITPVPGLPAGPKTCVRWSPDGRTIAYAGREGKDGAYSVENLELYVYSVDDGTLRCLTRGSDHCLLAVTVADTAEAEFAPVLEFTPDSRRLFTRIGWQGEMHIASIAVKGGKIEFHTEGPLDCALGNLSKDGRLLAATVARPTRPAEVAVLNTGAKKVSGTFDRNGPEGAAHQRFLTPFSRLTDLNGPLLAERLVAEPRANWVTAEDGHRVQVWSLMPPSHNGRDQKLPAALEIHGGPHAQYGSGFFHEFQVLAAAGYAVFYSNPRGSKGYGRDHCAAIRGKWGTADWLDIQAVTRFIKSQPHVDPDRVAVMGGSYGGYMTNWAIGHSREYAAAITDRCVSNLVSMSGTSDGPIEPDIYFPGNFWDRPEARWAQSPIAYLGNAKTPTLIIHSEGDLRCNVEQAEQVFTALKLLGVPTRFVRYPPTTSHGMSRSGPPDLRLHRLGEMLRWLNKYLMKGRGKRTTRKRAAAASKSTRS